MKALDRALQKLRLRRVRRHIHPGSVVLDFGCHNGQLFKLYGHLMAGGIGIDQDSNLAVFQDPAPKNFRFVCGGLELLTPENVPRVNFVAALAVMEHLAEVEIREFAQRLKKLVEPKAIILITIPHPLVDKIVAAGITLRLLSGQDINAHHGVKPLTVCSVIGSEGWQLVSWKRFQFGFNNELIFSQK